MVTTIDDVLDLLHRTGPTQHGPNIEKVSYDPTAFALIGVAAASAG